MARQPKNFSIAWVSVERLEPFGYLETGPDTAVPSRFKASFQLANPEAAVTMEVFVGADLRPVVLEMNIRARVRTPVTTSLLRSVLVDQLLQAALEKATVSSAERDEWLAAMPSGIVDTAGAKPSPSADERVRGNAEEDARTAARVYKEALASGSRAPAVAVARQMNRSRGQVARYIRRAREMGLLPALDSTQGAAK